MAQPHCVQIVLETLQQGTFLVAPVVVWCRHGSSTPCAFLSSFKAYCR